MWTAPSLIMAAYSVGVMVYPRAGLFDLYDRQEDFWVYGVTVAVAWGLVERKQNREAAGAPDELGSAKADQCRESLARRKFDEQQRTPWSAAIG